MVYLDTSALAKWYLNEPRSEDFAAWMQEQDDTHIRTLPRPTSLRGTLLVLV